MIAGRAALVTKATLLTGLTLCLSTQVLVRPSRTARTIARRNRGVGPGGAKCASVRSLWGVLAVLTWYACRGGSEHLQAQAAWAARGPRVDVARPTHSSCGFAPSCQQGKLCTPNHPGLHSGRQRISASSSLPRPLTQIRPDKQGSGPSHPLCSGRQGT